MSNYTQTTNFTAKDSLPSGTLAKRIRGSEFDVEFSAIVAAVSSKADTTYVDTEVGTKQDELVSGTNIKTVNGNSLLGSGNVSISTGDVYGPASSIDNTLPRFDGTTGKLLQGSGVAVDDSNNVTGVASMNGGQLAGMRNKIINGKMEVNQRGATSVALDATLAYRLDRWAVKTTSVPSGTLLTGQTTTAGVGMSVPSNTNGLFNVQYFQRQSGSYTGGLKVLQVLETINSRDLAGKTVTLSFSCGTGSAWAGGNVTASVLTSTGTDQTSAAFDAGTATGQATAGSTTITPTTTLTSYSVSVSIPSSANQVAILFTTSGWTGGSGTALDIIGVTGVQLEVGSVATPFEHRPFGAELALCQRYYETGDVSSSSGMTTAVAAATAYKVRDVYFAVTKRATPTIGFSGSFTYTQCASASTSNVDTKGFVVTAISSFANSNIRIDTGGYTASAEL
jgi:hypothetical protein